MKYGAVVLYHRLSPLSAVDFSPAADALLAGGVFLDSLLFLPYDEPSALSSALSDLMKKCGAVFLIADEALLPAVGKLLREWTNASGEGPLFETKSCLFALLPTGMGGAELVRTVVIPRVDERRGQSYHRMVLRAVGAPAETLSASMKEAGAVSDDLILHAREKYGETKIEIIYNRSTPKVAVDEAARILAEALKDHLYALEDVSPAQRLVEALKVRRRKIAVAESFTGGGVGREIVRVPGASQVFYEGLNPYDPNAKAERLGVTSFTLSHRGAVSDEAAYEMAAGLLAGGHCDYAVATTGVAGPGPDEKGNPAGLCFLAVGTKEQVNVYRFRLSGDRETVTETAIRLALFLAYKEVAET